MCRAGAVTAAVVVMAEPEATSSGPGKAVMALSPSGYAEKPLLAQPECQKPG